MARVVLIEDEPDLREIVQYNLTQAGHRVQTAATAEAVGLNDRGRIEIGLRADINLIDFTALRLFAPELAYDMPAGGKRLIQRAEGYVATVVAGEITYRNGEATGALPGRLIRGARPAPANLAA
jgi:N-acyl-D-aspartate/D-glutamate deacylase